MAIEHDDVSVRIEGQDAGPRACNGTFAFGRLLPSPVGKYVDGMAIGDLNGDGRLDVVTAKSDSMVSVLLGMGNGRFASKQD